MDEIDKAIQPLFAQLANALSEEAEPARETGRHYRVYNPLEANGLTWKEAYQIVRAIVDEARYPTSRSKANRIHRALQALRDAGIDPETMAVAHARE